MFLLSLKDVHVSRLSVKSNFPQTKRRPDWLSSKSVFPRTPSSPDGISCLSLREGLGLRNQAQEVPVLWLGQRKPVAAVSSPAPWRSVSLVTGFVSCPHCLRWTGRMSHRETIMGAIRLCFCNVDAAGVWQDSSFSWIVNQDVCRQLLKKVICHVSSHRLTNNTMGNKNIWKKLKNYWANKSINRPEWMNTWIYLYIHIPTVTSK